MPDHDAPQPLHLEPVEGPPLGPIAIEPGRMTTLGRSSTCDIQLTDAGISRHHASINHRAPLWFVTDLGSRQGTALNGVPLVADRATPLRDGDLIRLTPWTFRVKAGASNLFRTLTMDDSVSPQRVERIAIDTIASLARHRLDLLIECSAAINSATDEESLAGVVLDAAIAGTGFTRAAVIRPVGAGNEVQVIGYRGPEGAAGPSEPGTLSAMAFSRSLLKAASGGQMARLATDPSIPTADSIVSLGITSALCAPIMLGSSIASFLYLDARREEARVHPDAAAFSQAIARICGLALANLKRLDLEGRQRQLDRDLVAARQAQELIMPAERGVVGCLQYAMRVRPGRLVAGDLFDVVPLDDGRVGVFIGDVTGEGIGAAILMATAQSYLHAALLRYGDPAMALDEVNRFVTHRSALDKFVSLWVGVFDGAAGVVSYADAGHGHWLWKPAGERPRRVIGAGGLPVGIDPQCQYETVRHPLGPGDRLILFSDGAIEQDALSGGRFGLDRVIDVLGASRSVQQDVESLFEAVEAFAGSVNLADDTTVASMEFTAS